MMPDVAQVVVQRVRLERTRQLCPGLLGLALWRQLRLDEFFETHIDQAPADVPWSRLVLAYFAGRWLEVMLAGVTPADIQTFAAVVVLTLLMASIGTLRPTLRAVRVDPITAIRAE